MSVLQDRIQQVLSRGQNRADRVVSQEWVANRRQRPTLFYCDRCRCTITPEGSDVCACGHKGY